MQHLRTILLIGCMIIFVAAGIGWYQSAYANSGASPGSAADPVVTKSYVDEKVAELVKAELQKIGDIGSTGGEVRSESQLEVVVVPVGKTMIVKAGGELVVRTGSAIAVSNDTNGLSDMTDGVDIPPGQPVGNNHLILFPRDGRGIKHDPQSKVDMIVLVRGGYELK